jgi:hypothetical protein
VLLLGEQADEMIVSPRKSWLPSWLNTQNVSNGIITSKSLIESKEKLSDILNSLGCSFHFSRKGTRIRAKYAKGRDFVDPN